MNYCFTCGKETPDDDPEDECAGCRDEREKQERREWCQCDHHLSSHNESGACTSVSDAYNIPCECKQFTSASTEQWWEESR